MASTEEQDLNGQSSLSGLLGENQTQSTITMGSPKKETIGFESFPPEIRNMVYRHLFPPLCKGSKPRMLNFDWPSTLHQASYYEGHYTYIYDTAILRSNHLIGQEAKAVLYGDNMFVLFNLTYNYYAYYMTVGIPENIAWNPVRKGAPVPSCVVQINYGRKAGEPEVHSFIVAAADVNLICKELNEGSFSSLAPKAGYSLVALPQLGWQHEHLLNMIWLPLKALRERWPIAGIKVIDCTGVFEQTVEDEGDGSGSENSESGDNNSCDEEDDGEEDIEDVDRTANDSDDVCQEVNNGDVSSTSGESGEGDSDEAASVKSHEHCNNDPRAKRSPYTTSTSSHDAYANAQITIFNNNAAQGCSGEDTGHQMHDDIIESKADVDTIMDKKDAETQ